MRNIAIPKGVCWGGHHLPKYLKLISWGDKKVVRMCTRCNVTIEEPKKKGNLNFKKGK